MSAQEPSGTASAAYSAHYQGAANENKVPTPPSDCISCIRFTPDPAAYSLLVSSWDTTVRMYGVGMTSSSVCTSVIDTCTPFTAQDSDHCASGALDGTVKLFDLVNRHEMLLGAHEKAVRCIEFCEEQGLIYSGSWDTTVKQWDPRVQGATNSIPQAQRVYAMGQCGVYLVVGTASRKVLVWDVRQMSAPVQSRDSSLKYQTRCIRAFPNKVGYVLSSIEGRVAVEYLQEDETHKKYAFKCHRSKEDDGTEMIYPVNALAFHPIYNTFATGGSDALVNIWDPLNKKRLCQFHKYNTSVSSLAFSRDGQLLAIACSYQYEEADPPAPFPQDMIYVRRVTDQETKPKMANSN